jgi:hypothetical protein
LQILGSPESAGRTAALLHSRSAAPEAEATPASTDANQGLKATATSLQSPSMIWSSSSSSSSSFFISILLVFQ